MLGKIEGRRRRGLQRMRWLDGITDSMDTGFCGYGLEFRSPTEHNVLFQTAYVVGPDTRVIWAPSLFKSRGRAVGG